MNKRDYFTTAISRHIWDSKYRYREDGRVHDADITDTWRRIARALAEAEPHGRDAWARRFYDALEDFRFIPGGRIHAGAGTRHRVTLFNCFVMGLIDDSMDGIFDALKEGAVTLQQGGGVGYDFSTLRPKGSPARSVGAIASGPVSFMHIWDSMCATLLSTGARRGAMMATLRCDHPDIEAFIAAKQDRRSLRHFNLSVLVSDDFVSAVREDREWLLVFPERDLGGTGGETVLRRWSGEREPVPCRVMKRVAARDLWERIMRATYDYAEPGVLFIDRINRYNNLYYREQISATNPCVTADTWVHTAEGPRQVRELLGRRFTALVNGRLYRSSPRGFFSTGRRAVLRLRTREGYTLRLTADHPVLRVARYTPRGVQTAWTRVAALRPGDRVVLHNHCATPGWPGAGTWDEGRRLGRRLGGDAPPVAMDGPGVRAARACGASAAGVPGALAALPAWCPPPPAPAPFPGWATPGPVTVAAAPFPERSVPRRPSGESSWSALEHGSSDFCRGFLRGLFDLCATLAVERAGAARLRLAHEDGGLVAVVQRMLLRLGMTGLRRATPACHELVLTGDTLRVFAGVVGFDDVEKRRILNATRAAGRQRFTATVAAVEPAGTEEVYDVQIPGINAFDANGFYVHNCGEIPLPPYGACDLGSINLTRFVRRPFSRDADFDFEAVAQVVGTAVRMLDNVIDVSRFPLAKQAEQARGSRRIGLGMTGLADTLILLGMTYGDEASLAFAARAMRTICHAAYRASIGLAREKGAFPFFERDAYLASEFIATLPADLRAAIAEHGIRNSHLTAIAPTGTISLLANNISSGLEPVFDFSYQRRVLELDGSYTEYRLRDYALVLWNERHPDAQRLPPQFVDARELPPEVHIDMQAAVQPYVDNAISKTINVPEDYAFDAFRNIYAYAYDKGLKGCTTFRPNPVTGAVLRAEGEGFERASHCCDLEREAD